MLVACSFGATDMKASVLMKRSDVLMKSSDCSEMCRGPDRTWKFCELQKNRLHPSLLFILIYNAIVRVTVGLKQ